VPGWWKGMGADADGRSGADCRKEQGRSDSIGKSRWREILSQSKVVKTVEYCVDFLFLTPHEWGKRSVIRPQAIYSGFPQYGGTGRPVTAYESARKGNQVVPRKYFALNAMPFGAFLFEGGR